ncbi:MAG TPA: efflux RND transporter permease subunit, partial [Verrucomicrobiae bacterium]|nr:efflux RND transporter permease subunit [Verrucomicrobiae bacterium]
MNFLSKFALKNPTVIFFLMFLILFGGIFSASQMKTEAMPDVKIPFVVVSTLYPGASPDDVLQSVTKPIEKATTGIKGLKLSDSHSIDSMSIVVLQFEYSTEMDQAERQVQEAINKLSLPEQVQKPKVSRVSFDDSPILVISATGGTSTAELEKAIRDKVQPELSGIQGVGSLDINGLSDSNIYIKVDPAKLKDKGLTLENVRQTLIANNISFPTGEVNMEQKTLPLRVAKKLTNVDDIRNIPIVVQPNMSVVMGESLGQMDKALSGLAQGMGTIGQQLGIMGQGMGQLGQGVGNATQGTAIVAQIQLIQTQLQLLKEQAVALSSQLQQLQNAQAEPSKIAAVEAALAQVQTQIQRQSGVLMGLNQALATWLSQQKAPAPSATTQTPATQPSGGKKVDVKSPELKIETVPLGDVATVLSGSAVPSSYTRTDAKPSVVVNVLKDGDANTVEVAKNVHAKLAELKKELPAGIEFTTLYDQSNDIKGSVNGMLREGLLGALFAVIIIALFLRNLRATLVAIVSIPLSI